MTKWAQDQSDNAAVVITDLEGRVLHRSNRISEILGRSNDEVIGKVFDSEWLAGASLADARDMLAQCLNSGSAAEHQLICRDRDGHEFPLWVECSLVTDNSGEPVNITWLIRDTESSRQLLEALAESKEKYRHLFEFSPEAIFIISLDGLVLDCNPTAGKIVGLKCDVLLKQTLRDLPVFDATARKELDRHLHKLVDGAEPLQFDLRILRNGSELHWLENFASLITSDGRPYAIQLITRDITEKKMIEQDLRVSEERFRELADLFPQTVFEIDVEGKLTYVNSTALKQFGYTQADFEGGLTAGQMFVPEDQERMVENIRLRLQDKIPTGRDYTALRKDGSTFPVRTYTSGITRDGKVVGLRGLVLDMTEIKQAEAQLRESEERFRELADLFPQTVFEIDVEGKLTYVNQQALQQFGYTQADFEGGLTATQMFVPGDRERLVENIQLRLQDEGPVGIDYNALRKNGSIFSARVYSSRITRDGKIVGLRGLILDMTEIKQTEAQLRESEERFRTIAESMPVALLITRAEDGVALYANPRFLAQLQTDDPKDIAHSMKRYYSDPTARDQMLAELENRGSLRDYELQFTRPDGTEALVSISLEKIVFQEERALLAVVEDITERRQATLALRESEQRYRELQNNVPIGIFQSTPTGELRFVNREFAMMLGYESEEDIITYQALHHYVDPKMRQEFVDTLLNDGFVRDFEVQLYCKDRSTIWVSSQARAVHDAEGNLEYFDGTLIDITARRQFEKAEREAREQLSATLDALPDLLFEVDREGRLWNWRSSSSETLYLPPESFIGKTVAEVLPEDAATIIMKTITEAAATGKHRGAIYSLSLPSGERWYELSIAAKGSLHSEELHLIVMARDVTERVLAEQALRESEQRYRELQNNVPIGIFQSTPTGEIRFVNREALRITGYESEEEFRNLSAFGNYVDPKKIDEFADQLLSNGFIRNFEAEFRRKDGSIIWANLQAKAVYDKQGKLSHFDGSFRDVTDRRKAQQALEEIGKQLSATLDAIPDLLFEIDREGRLWDWHASSPEALYAPPESFIGKTVAEILPEDATTIIMKAIEEAAATGNHRGAIYSLDLPSGVKWFELSIAAKDSPHSEELHLIATARDVTERVLAEQALRESEGRYRDLQDNVPIGIFQSTPEGEVLFANREVVRLFGYESKEELMQHSALNVYVDPEKRQALITKLQQRGFVKGFEAEFKRRDGSLFWGSLDITAACNEEGEITRFDGILVDITERKLAEEALTASEEKYRLLVENIDIVILRSDYDGRFLFLNEAGAKLLNTIPAAIVGKTVWELFPEETAKRMLELLQKAIDSGESVIVEGPFVIGPERLWFRVKVEPYPFLQDGKPSATVMGEDITLRKRAEEELQLAHEGLKAEQQALVVKNIALKELLGQIDDEKERIMQHIQANLDQAALPLLANLRERLPADLEVTAGVLEQCLRDIASPYIGELKNRFSSLTPREVEICNMIRNGLQSKDIANDLHISVRTVEKFRQQIRRKLDIVNQETNLTSFLRNL